MAKSPSRIDLLELDIDLRLTDLWREAAEISDWNLDVVAAFMRAAFRSSLRASYVVPNLGFRCAQSL